MQLPEYTGAAPPERISTVENGELRLHVHEWGDPDRPPLLLTHGMFDHGRGFDLVAAHFASRFRVVAPDARGHGDSSWADAYLWPADVHDVLAVLRWLDRPAHVLGHSRGGGLVMDAAMLAPERVRAIVNIDGFGPPPEGFEAPWHPRDERSLPERFSGFLDWRRGAARRDRWRPYRSLDALVARRRAQNPRLATEWLRYFCFHGARHTEAGWVWKADPHAGRGFGPWKPDWIAPAWTRLRAPVLAITGSQRDSWGPLPEPLLSERLAFVPELCRASVEGAGHFVHMERPRETAELVLDFLEAA